MLNMCKVAVDTIVSYRRGVLKLFHRLSINLSPVLKT